MLTQHQGKTQLIYLDFDSNVRWYIYIIQIATNVIYVKVLVIEA